jgi:hypothetical protein
LEQWRDKRCSPCRSTVERDGLIAPRDAADLAELTSL